MTMTGAEDYLKEIIRLQLKKPKSWNWELSTSKSSPHISLPTIQLYNTKGQLLVKTNDNGTTNKQSWNSSQYRERSKERESTRSSRNPAYLQRCRSDNLEKRMAIYRASIASTVRPTIEIKAQEIKKQPKVVQRCRSDTLAIPSLQNNNLSRSNDSLKYSRSRSRELNFQKLREKYNPETNEKGSGGSSDCIKSNKGKLGKFGQFVEGMKNDKRESKDTGGIYRLQKSRSDVLDIKVKSTPQHTLSDKHPIRPYHRRSDSDDLIQKTRQKYNIKESLKRAENDGYKNFIYSDENLKRNLREESWEKKEQLENNDEKKRRLIGCLATAETVICNNKPKNFEVNNVAKPKRYRLRQSRAGTLVISDESFSSSHRRRCHGEFGDCRYDSNDIIVDENTMNSWTDFPVVKETPRTFVCTPLRSRLEKEKDDVRRTSHDVSGNNSSRSSRHFRQSSDPAGVKTAKFLPNRYRRPQHTNDVSNNVERTESTRETFSSRQNSNKEHCLFQSKSDVFPFQKLFKENSIGHNKFYEENMSIELDDNCNYIVQEPLTTPGSESDKNVCDSVISKDFDKKRRTKVRERHSDGFYACMVREDITEEFYMWLTHIEEENKLKYIRKKGTCTGKTHSRLYYECNRSGMKPETIMNRKRCQKFQGSQKIGFRCTSHLVVKVDKNTAVHVKYWKTHYGHDIQIQHIRIPDSARKNIAGKLMLGVSVPKIIDSIRDGIGDSYQKLNRVDIITRMDIHNIKKSFKIDITDGIRHSDDATSVSLWVQECAAEENTPVLFYKAQGMDDEKYHLKPSDFCLILMNKLQIEVTKVNAHKFVCIDGTHGTNPYDFELNTLMVGDEFGEGMPVAYMISNKKDSSICSVFFKVIKDTVGIITTNTFMSDITNTYYNAWQSVMGTVPNRIFCSWHIDRAWRSNLMKIVSSNHETSVEKRKEVYKALKMVQTTLDEEKFFKFYNELLLQLQSDSETKKFYDYFIREYGSNFRSWAYCYRKELMINTNMYLESMHRVIKYEYLEGKKVKRLDRSIHNLMRFTRDKQVDRIIKLTKGKGTDRISGINASHKRALTSSFDLKQNEEDEGNKKWSLFNNTNKKMYTVSKRTSDQCCALACQNCKICYHSYSCTCIDYCIKSNICKHIHFICIQTNKNNNSTSINEHVTSQEDIELCLIGNKNIEGNKQHLQERIISTALEVVALASKPVCSEILSSAYKQLNVTKSLLQLADVPNTSFKFQNTESKNEPSNKKIMKQLTFFSTKRKKTNTNNSEELRKPTLDERSNLELVLSKKLEISNSSLNDHTYTAPFKL